MVVLFFLLFVVASIAAIYFFNKYNTDIKAIADALDEKSQAVDDLVAAIKNKTLNQDVNLAKLKKAQDDLIAETQRAVTAQTNLDTKSTELAAAIQKAQDIITKTNDIILQYYLTADNADVVKKLVNIRDFVLPKYATYECY
jgi:hypothetical protein